jgi:type IV pilus assembly protein PilM
MIKLPGRTTRTPIGLDIGSRIVKAVQLTGGPGAWRVTGAAMIPRESEGPISGPELLRLRDVLERQGFAGNRIVVSAPDKQLVTSMLELPPKSLGAPIDQLARVELSNMHKLDAATIEMAYWELPSTGRQREQSRVMAVAYRHSDADALLSLLENAGFEVAAIDLRAAALARVAEASVEARDQIVAMLELGWSASALVILHKGVIVYERRLNDACIKPLADHLTKGFEFEPDVVDYLLSDVGLSSESGDDAIASDQLEDIRCAIVEHFADMVGELAVSFSYASHQYPDAALNEVLLVGGGAAIPGLATHLSQATKTKMTLLSPAVRAEVPAGLANVCKLPLMTAAMGLAMHEGDAA